MDKYKELIDRLRTYSDFLKFILADGEYAMNQYQKAMGDAADAIEELLKVQDQMGDDIAMMNEELLKHEWIPCDKDEPDEDMECWVTAKTTDALYRGNFTKRYGERRDKGFITSGGFMWWNTALAWMPFERPAPYKEEE